MRTRGKETRQAIMRAAERVFAERGYAGARMDDVAIDVGIKRASMVYYFRDKRSLYLALLDDLFGELLQRHRAVLTGPGTARERILGCLEVWTSAVAERPGLVRIMMWESARVRRATAAPLAQNLAPILSTIADAISAGQRDGSFRDVDPMRFLMVVTGATAFLTLGMNVLTSETAPLSAPDLHRELEAVVERILFVD
jgi:TetR/AcrR family transcriptional regulator